MLDALRVVKIWQAAVLVTLLVGTAGGTYGGYVLATRSGGDGLGENQQLIPVQRGDLVNLVSTNGSLVFPNRELLTFGTQGTLGEIMVEEGQRVEEGQALAKLDAATVASVERVAAQARVDLKRAEDALAKARDPHSPLDMAKAESKAAGARVSLQNARDALDRLLHPSAQDKAQAEAKVANAKLSLQNALDALDRLLIPSAQELAQAETAVTNAKLSVENARESLDALRTGPAQEDLAAAQAQVDAATTSLTNALGDLSLARKEWDGKLKKAGEAVDASRESYLRSFRKWLGIDAGQIEEPLDPDTLLAAWGVDLDALFRPGPALPPEDPGTPWNEFVVYAWTNLFGAVVPTCDDIVLAPQTMCVKREMDDGWDAFQSAIDSSDTVQTQSAKAMANAETAVTRSRESLAASESALEDLKTGAGLLQIQSKENQLTLALATLGKAEADLADLGGMTAPEKDASVQTAKDSTGDEAVKAESPSNILAVEAQRQQVAVAQANLDEAKDGLAELLGGPDPLQLDAQGKQVAVSQASLGNAEEELAELRGSVDPLEVTLRESDVAAAHLALTAALERLDAAVLRSPVAGIVSTVNVEAGQTVNPNTLIVEVVDPSVVEVNGIVDEIDVLFVRVGATAQVTMDALPSQVLAGIVSSVASAAQTQQGVVTYPIRIQVEVPEGVQLREGLTAVAKIVLRQDNNVLLVPNQTVYGTFQEPQVRVKGARGIEERAVVLGNSDDFWVAVLGGLAEGELVVMETAQAATSQPGLGGGRGLGGGGLGGGFGAGAAGLRGAGQGQRGQQPR